MLESRDIGERAEKFKLEGITDILHDDCRGCEWKVSALVRDLRTMGSNLLSTLALMLLWGSTLAPLQ